MICAGTYSSIEECIDRQPTSDTSLTSWGLDLVEHGRGGADQRAEKGAAPEIGGALNSAGQRTEIAGSAQVRGFSPLLRSSIGTGINDAVS